MGWVAKHSDTFAGDGDLDAAWVQYWPSVYYHGTRVSGNYRSSQLYTISADRYNDTWANDQYSEVIPVNDIYARAFVRMTSANSGNHYLGMWFPETGGHVNCYKTVDGVQTELGSGVAVSTIAGLSLRIRIVGGDIVVSVNGVDKLTPATDTSHASGYSGLGADGWNTNPNPLYASWEGGEWVDAPSRKRIRRMISAGQLTGMALLGVLIKNPSFSRKEMMDIIRLHK